LTLFTASPSREEAVVPAGAKRTMFSGCLLDVLHNGIPEEGPLSTLHEIAAQVRVMIAQRHSDDGVRPGVHSPRQRYGDVADFPRSRVSGDFRCFQELPLDLFPRAPERQTMPARQDADEADKGNLEQARLAMLQVLHLLQ
jgi:hypothetical protein